MIFRIASWALLSGIAFVLAACATPAALVEPLYFIGDRYTERSCDQLGQEKARLTQALATASKHQGVFRQERAQELGLELGVGLPVLAFLVVGSLYGGGDLDAVFSDINLEAFEYYDTLAPEIARLKGEINAVNRTMAFKICQTAPPSAPASQ
jgi:hypothetical protein